MPINRLGLVMAYAEIAGLLKAQWGQAGRWAMEFPILDRIIAAA